MPVIVWSELLPVIGQHLALVLISTSIAVLIGVPTGIAIARRERLKRPVIGLANVLQTIPSLALFGFLLPLPLVGGIGARTAIVALVLYALLPLVRNTVVGIEGVDPAVREAAIAMGMTPRQILTRVELPLSLGVIFTGVRVATVVSVGVATIAAAIGAGGLGTYIFRGLRMNDNALILEGAVPSAAIALGLDFALGVLAARVDRLAHPPTAARSTLRSRRYLLLAALGAAAAIVVPLVLARRPGQAPSAATGTPGSQASGAPSARGTGGRPARSAVVVGAKDFTESILLAELLAQSLEERGVLVERAYELGGNLCHEALIAGRIDAYPEYTGTALTALLHQPLATDPAAVAATVRRLYRERFHVATSDGIGFRNDFAILVRGSDARRLGLRTISDVAAIAPGLRAGFGQDFVSRPDGYAGLARVYGLRWKEPPREMDLSLTYRALAAGKVDLIAGNSTDGLIEALDLRALVDDRSYFPPYEAVYLAREQALERVPALGLAIESLVGAIDGETMRRLNLAVDGDRRPPAEVARDWRRVHRNRISQQEASVTQEAAPDAALR